ncbi:MAG: dTMP kinase [Pseudomonadota bacterium]
MPKRAYFVTLEGTEGVGKSTQLRALTSHFRHKGLRVLVTREPGGSPLSDSIRGVLLKSGGFHIDPVSELLLIEAARRQHVTDVLEKALVQNDLVICDRFTDSTLAYQGGGRQLDLSWLRKLNRWVTGGLVPDLTILLDMPVDSALKRAMKRLAHHRPGEAEDRFEREKRAFHSRVRVTYLGLARAEPARFFVVDASEPPKTITRAILARLEPQVLGR